MRYGSGVIATSTVWALLMAALGAAVVIVTRQGTITGALAGLLVAALAILGLGPGTLLPLAVFVLGAGALTRVGRGIKERHGAAEAHHGRRGAAHVAANLGIPMLLAVAGLVAGPDGSRADFLRVAFVASLCAAFADTAATETGPLARGQAYSLRTFPPRRVPHGTEGGVSLAGVAAAAIAAAACAGAATLTRAIPGGAWAFVAAAGLVATLFESVLAGTPAGQILGHHGRNAAASAVAAGAAFAAWTAAVAAAGATSYS
jgi:uncharacterized protein (TIGR00297 family)